MSRLRDNPWVALGALVRSVSRGPDRTIRHRSDPAWWRRAHERTRSTNLLTTIRAGGFMDPIKALQDRGGAMCLDGTREAVRSRLDPHQTPAGPTQHHGTAPHHPMPQEQTEPAPGARFSRRRLLASGIGAAAVTLVPGTPAAATPTGACG